LGAQLHKDVEDFLSAGNLTGWWIALVMRMLKATDRCGCYKRRRHEGNRASRIVF
jgi:hypothetical protein